jgi:hypothetical protein
MDRRKLTSRSSLSSEEDDAGVDLLLFLWGHRLEGEVPLKKDIRQGSSSKNGTNVRG